MTALALREDQDFWDDKQLAVLYQLGAADENSQPSNAELASFLHECQQRKLDPFTKQIYLIGRYDKRAGRKVYRSQTGIDGFRLIARRAADRSGVDYSYEDTIWFDADGGKHEVWLSDGPPAACKIVVVRNGCRYDAVARYGAYVQTDRDGRELGLWKTMPDVLIAKCAESLALRKAFPEDLGGIYTDVEMAQADNPDRPIQATAEVVREESAARSLPEPSEAEDPWLAAALEMAPKHASLDACGVAWRKSAELVREEKITKADAAKLQDLLRKRMEELKAAETHAEDAAATVVADLDDGDPWADKINDIGSDGEAEAVLGEAGELLDQGEIDAPRYEQIGNAVEARLARITQKQAA